MGLTLPQASWVILSACNTAADDGSGEALSGLARAFFYAGAASLLVSQWSVDDVATRVLMTEVFRRQAEDPYPPAGGGAAPGDAGGDDAGPRQDRLLRPSVCLGAVCARGRRRPRPAVRGNGS